MATGTCWGCRCGDWFHSTVTPLSHRKPHFFVHSSLGKCSTVRTNSQPEQQPLKWKYTLHILSTNGIFVCLHSIPKTREKSALWQKSIICDELRTIQLPKKEGHLRLSVMRSTMAGKCCKSSQVPAAAAAARCATLSCVNHETIVFDVFRIRISAV